MMCEQTEFCQLLPAGGLLTSHSKDNLQLFPLSVLNGFATVGRKIEVVAKYRRVLNLV